MLVIAWLLLVPPGAAQSLQETPDPPKTEIPAEEREAFMQLWLDVLARGAVSLNDTPETGYPQYADELKFDLATELVARLKAESPEIAAQFDPAVAGPLFGLSTPEDPLMGIDGEPLTQERIDQIYMGFLGGLIFDRAAFLERLESLLEPLTSGMEDFQPPEPGGEEDMRNEVREAVLAQPDEYYATDLLDPVAPDGFVVAEPAAVGDAPALVVTPDLSGVLATSPFRAETMHAWLDPEFRLALPNLLAFLRDLTGVPTDALLERLGLLAEEADAIVETVEGTLDEAFPALATRRDDLRTLEAVARGSVVDVTTPLRQAILSAASLDDPLPAEVDAALARAESLAASAQYAAVVNGVPVNGTWGAPVLVDLNGDGAPDASLQLDLAASTTMTPLPAASSVPRFTLARVDPASAAAAAVEGATPPDAPPAPELPADAPELPVSALTSLDLVLAYRIPDTETLVVYVASVDAAPDLLEVRLLDEGPSLGLQTVGGAGAFAFTAARLADGDMRGIEIEAAAPPAVAEAHARLDVALGEADLSASLPTALDGRVAATRIDALGRLSLGAASDTLASFTASAIGCEFELAPTAGSALSLARQHAGAGAGDAFTTCVLDVRDAPASIDAELASDELRVTTSAAGGSVAGLVGTVADGAFTSATWFDAQGMGRRVALQAPLDGVRFTADRNVQRVSVVRATGDAAAIAGNPATGVLVRSDDVVAFTLDAARAATVFREGDGYTIDATTASSQPFTVVLSEGADQQVYTLSALPPRLALEVDAEGISLGASSAVDEVTGYLVRHLDGPSAAPTHTIVAVDDVAGTVSLSMADAAVNAFVGGTASAVQMRASNLVGPDGPVFAALNGDHTLALVEGLVEQQSATLLKAVGSVTGGLFGPLGQLTIELDVAGGFCQSFGADGTQLVLCLSNVPDRIDLSTQALPSPVITYDATEAIHLITMQMIAPDVDALFSIREVPRHMELALGPQQMVVSTDTRLQEISLLAEVGATTIGAAVLDLPTSVTLTWGSGGLVPTMPAGDAIGRAWLFVSQPSLSFLVDLVHLPTTTFSWSSGAFSAGPVGDRIGSATVQLALPQLQLVLAAQGIPGLSASWTAAGGALSTTGTLDAISLSIAKGAPGAPEATLVTSLTGVPRLTSSWTSGSLGLTLVGGGKIGAFDFDFRAGSLVIDLSAQGVPSATFTMSGGAFTLNAPAGIDAVTAILAKGSGYYNPAFFATDFVGLYLRPDSATFGISARFTGVRGVSFSKSDATRSQTIGLGFVQDKTLRVIADLDGNALTAYADLVLSNVAAATTIVVHPDGVTLNGVPVNPSRPSPMLQAEVGIGSPTAFDQTPWPRWPWQTTGLATGVMGNTMVDTTAPGTNVATKWRVYAPLPNVLSVGKATSNGLPTTINVNTGQSLGKLDVRTNLKVNLNLCGGCTPYYLNTLAVSTVSNLPATLSLAQGLGSGASAGSPSFTLTTGSSVQNVFLGVRFDGAWYANAATGSGFPIWARVSDIPTSVALTISKNGGWSAGNTPKITYSANANTLDAALFLDVGELWTMFGKTTINNAASVGRPVPSWLVGLAQYDARGHLLLEIVNLPAAGVSIFRDGQAIVVDPLGSVPLTKFFADFNLRLERNLGNSGCWICGAIRLDWWWSFGYWFEIDELSLLLENLRYVRIDPNIETVIALDGHLVFHFRAQVGINFSAGVRLSLHVLGLDITILCVCVPSISLSAMVDPGFITFQVNTYTWGLNYWTWAYPCHFTWYGWPEHWCHDHENVGVTYTIPDHWQWDLPIAYPPLVPFRGLNLYSGTHHVILNPRVLNCAGDVCWEVGRLIPVSLVMAYAYLKYFSISDVQWWSVHHHH